MAGLMGGLCWFMKRRQDVAAAEAEATAADAASAEAEAEATAADAASAEAEADAANDASDKEE
jgi:hypothetical protein